MATWSGDATQTTAEVSAYRPDLAEVGLAVSTNPDLSQARICPVMSPNAGGWNKWSLSTLSPATRYYHQLFETTSGGNVRPLGAVSTFKTLQPVGPACTIRIAVGSCNKSRPGTRSAFSDIAQWAPDRMVHLGDFGYPGDLSRNPLSHMRSWANGCTDEHIRRVMEMMCMDYVVSDHDCNGSGESNRPNYQDPITMANIAAWVDMVPARMDDTEVPAHGRWRADVEGNVRFIKLDTRSIDRTDNVSTPTGPDSPESTMLGATQLTWLKGQIDSAVTARQLIILFSDCGWNGRSPGPPIPETFCDKWPSYSYERDLISDYAASQGAQMFIVHGDTHGLQQDDGTHEKNGYAAICCGPLDHDVHMHYQEWYQWNYPRGFPERQHRQLDAQQYQRLAISQESGTSVITVTAEARDCSIARAGGPRTVRTMTKVYVL